MISYHPIKYSGRSDLYARGFKTVETVDLWRVAKCMAACVWSPCIWEGGVRNQTHFKEARFCALDFDDGEMTLEQAKKEFCDMRHVIGTTRSHQKEKSGASACDRFRVVFIWNEPITDLRAYRYNMYTLLKKYPVDKSCKDGARYFYPCKEIISIEADGYFLDSVKDVPEKFEVYPDIKIKTAYYNMGDKKIVPSFLIRDFNRRYRQFNRNNAIYGVSKDLTALGFSVPEIMLTIKDMAAYKIGTPLSDDEFIEVITNGAKG